MSFSSSVLLWYSKHKRDLPWRRTTDPYKILVSEIMLQQTQVDRVVPIYNNFLAQFPDVYTLARAPLSDVLKAWKGLGYNRRAKYLWLCAQEMIKFPYGNNEEKRQFLYRNIKKMTSEELEKLPGIGHYTAAAVLAFSANKDITVVDTNIRRIYHRYYRDASEEKIASVAPRGKAREWNNALMDFGSLVCTKKPACNECPLRKTCKAYKENDFAVIVPKQSTFKDSNRYYRGRIIDSLREGKKTKGALVSLGQKQKIEKALLSLEKDAMVKKDGKAYTL